LVMIRLFSEADGRVQFGPSVPSDRLKLSAANPAVGVGVAVGAGVGVAVGVAVGAGVGVAVAVGVGVAVGTGVAVGVAVAKGVAVGVAVGVGVGVGVGPEQFSTPNVTNAPGLLWLLYSAVTHAAGRSTVDKRTSSNTPAPLSALAARDIK